MPIGLINQQKPVQALKNTLLKNPFYAGKFEIRGEVFDGVQEPYISWDRYLSRLDRMGERWCGAHNYCKKSPCRVSPNRAK
jgi:hypothetical protein